MKQTRTASLGESVTSTAIGFVVSMVILEAVNRLWGLSLSLTDNVAITSLFTIASVLRSYLVRRLFNWWQHRGDEDEALRQRMYQRFEAEANATEAGHYVRIPDGMNLAEAIHILAECAAKKLFNSDYDITDILNEVNVVKPVA